jgi:four helix bundle protein
LRTEFSSKLHIALEEADESQYWLEMLESCGLSHGMTQKEVYQEAREITAILMSALKTTRAR